MTENFSIIEWARDHLTAYDLVEVVNSLTELVEEWDGESDRLVPKLSAYRHGFSAGVAHQKAYGLVVSTLGVTNEQTRDA